MGSLHVIGPLPILERLVQNKILELIQKTGNAVVNARYDFLSLILDNCRNVKDIQIQLERVVNSFNGSLPDSHIATILPTIIRNKLEEIQHYHVLA